MASGLRAQSLGPVYAQPFISIYPPSPDVLDTLTLRVDTNSANGVTWFLPTKLGTAGQFLTTKGVSPDTLYWSAGATGTVDTIKVNSTLTATPSPITSVGTLGVNLANHNIWLAAVGITDPTDEVPFIIKNGAGGNVSDLTAWEDNTGTPVLSIGDEGEIKASGSYGTAGYYLTSGGSEAAMTWTAPPTIPIVDSNYVQFNPTSASPHQIIYPRTDFVPLTINDTVTGATSDLQDWRVGGAMQARIDKNGWLWNSSQISENSIAWWNNQGQIQSTLLQKGQIPIGEGASHILAFDTITAGTGISVDNSVLGQIIISQSTSGNPDSGGYIVNQRAATQTAGFNIGPNAPAETTNFTEATIRNDATTSTSNKTRVALQITSRGAWNSSSGLNVGINFSDSSGTTNYDLDGTANTWSITNAGTGNFHDLTLITPLAVSYGGTGDASFTADQPILGGTTSTGALQSVSTTGMVAGDVLSTTYTVGSTASVPVWNHAPIVGSGTPFNGSAVIGTATTVFTLPGTASNYYIIDGIYIFATAVAGFVSAPAISIGAVGPTYTDLLGATTITCANVTTAYLDVKTSLVNPRNFYVGGTSIVADITTSGVGAITLETDIVFHAMK